MSESVVDRWRTPLLLGALALGLRVAFFAGFQNNDDRLYAEAAWDLLRGAPEFRIHLFATRLGASVPVALGFAALGPGTLPLVLPSLLSSIALTLLAWRIASRRMGPTAGVAAGVFVALFPLDVLYGGTGFFDGPLAAALGGGACLILGAEPGKPWVGRAVGAGLLWILAHLIKESALILLVPALPLLASEGRRRTLAAALGVAALGVLAESGAYLALTGDFLHRLHLAAAAQSGGAVEAAGLGQRLLELPRLLLDPRHPWLPYLAGFPFLALAGAAAAWRAAPAIRPIALWGAGVLAVLELFPLSILPFRPAISVQPRMLLAFALPAALLAGAGAERLRARPRLLLGLAAAAAALSLACSARLHADAVASRRALEWALAAAPPGSTLVSDPSSARGLRFLSGFRGDVAAWGERPDAPGTLRFRSTRGEEVSARLYGKRPPPAWAERRRPIAERRWPSPWSWRGRPGGEETASLE